MHSETNIAFLHPVVTDNLPGFLKALTDIAHARRVVEAERLPVARSHHVWVDACNRLTLAQASRNPTHIEAARLALTMAVAAERRLTASSWAAAA